MDLTPQQQLFLKGYTDPKSPTFGNALQSALKAGYSEEYANNITSLMPDWLSENIGKSKMVMKAERNLDMALDGLLDDPDKGGRPLQYKASEFTLKALKKEEYSDRIEHTGKDGKDLPTPIINLNNVQSDNITEQNS